MRLHTRAVCHGPLQHAKARSLQGDQRTPSLLTRLITAHAEFADAPDHRARAAAGDAANREKRARRQRRQKCQQQHARSAPGCGACRWQLQCNAGTRAAYMPCVIYWMRDGNLLAVSFFLSLCRSCAQADAAEVGKSRLQKYEENC